MFPPSFTYEYFTFSVLLKSGDVSPGVIKNAVKDGCSGYRGVRKRILFL